MPQQPSWNKYEVALLLDAYLEICKVPNDRISILQKLSSCLRKMAELSGIVFDETYRNYAGVSLQIRLIEDALCDNNDNPRISNLFKEVTRLYKTNKEQFNQLLTDAKKLAHFQSDKGTTKEQVVIVEDKINKHLIDRAEKAVLNSDMEGITYDGLQSQMNTSMSEIKRIVSQSSKIVDIKGHLYHEDSFIDWEDGSDRLESILSKLMQRNSGYISIGQLYEYARSEMNMFLNDNDMNDERSVYDIARHLFGKEGYHNYKYSFSGNMHISKTEETIGTSMDVFKRFASSQGEVFSYSDLEEYLTSVGIKLANLRGQMKLYDEPIFLYYDEGVLISVESMHINDTWMRDVKNALDCLFDDFDGHAILRNLPDIWLERLPALPGNHTWTPLLLQSVLRFFGNEFSARTIMAMDSQALDTLHTMVVKSDDQIQNFGDVIIWYLLENGIQKRNFEAEELRELLASAGILHARELITKMPKALKDDNRFAWDVSGKTLNVKVE